MRYMKWIGSNTGESSLPSRSLWSCVPTLWCICPPCTSGMTQMHAHISIPEWFYSIHRRCRLRREVQSTGYAPLQDRIPHSQQSWTDMLFLGCPGKTLKWVHRGLPGVPCSAHSCKYGGTCSVNTPEMSSSPFCCCSVVPHCSLHCFRCYFRCLGDRRVRPLDPASLSRNMLRHNVAPQLC